MICSLFVRLTRPERLKRTKNEGDAMKDLRGRVAVVTGAASGIGAGLVTALAAEDMKVMMADVDAARLATKVQEARAAGYEVGSHVVDVGDQVQVDRLADATIERFGRVHVVCNNAGIIRYGHGPSWEQSLQEWHDEIRVNLFGVIHGIRAFVPRLIESGEEGHIVNTSSLAAVTAVPGIAPYLTSKHGILGLSETLLAELQEIGAPIGVTVVMPGGVQTRIGQPAGAPDPDAPLRPGQMDPHEVGTRVVRAIQENRLHLFTHAALMGTAMTRFARFAESVPNY
jgi:NAD(P)-dependent dehydrogenase (short-subunit alcohol dehydrogenase family)